MELKFKQIRYSNSKDRTRKERNGSLIVACPAMKFTSNVSMLARSASCLGADEFIITGRNRINKRISRDCNVPIKYHNSLLPVIKNYKKKGYKAIGVEQSENSNNIYDYSFSNGSIMLIVGNESRGIEQNILNCLDEVIEIPLFGKPHSLNVVMAATICLFEYAKQCCIEKKEKR